VHVSNILAKLGASGPEQAAALAERAGLLHAVTPGASPKHRPRKLKDPRAEILGGSPIRAARSSREPRWWYGPDGSARAQESPS
jgi:hypothetical protein